MNERMREDYPKNLVNAVSNRVITEYPADLNASIEYVLHTLEPKERDVLYMRYRDMLNMEEICSKLGGVTKQTIYNIERHAMTKLMHPSRSKIILYGWEGLLHKKENEIKETYLKSLAMRIDTLVRKLGYEDTESDLQAMPIEDLELSIRSYNCLKRDGIDTVQKVLKCIKSSKLNEIRCLGKKGYDEIIQKITDMGFHI